MPKQTSLTGWLNVKKRGRDDQQIEQDKKKALEARSLARKKKTMAKPKTAKKTAPKTPARSKKTNKRSRTADSESEFEDDDDDDDNSMDDFVVDDDEFDEADEADDEEDLVHDSSSDEELVLTDSSTPKRQHQAKSKTSVTGDGESSSDDSDGGTFLQQYKHRPSKPTAPLQRAAIAAKTRRNPGLSLADRVASRGLRSIQAPAVKKRNAVSAKSKRIDDEELTSPSPEMVKRKKRTPESEESRPTRSKYFRSSKTQIQWNPFEAVEDSDDNTEHDKKIKDDDVSDVVKTLKYPRKEQTVTSLSDDSSDEELFAASTLARKTTDDSVLIDSPEPVTKKSAASQIRSKKRPKYQLSSDSEDDVQVVARPKTLAKKKKSAASVRNASIDDNHVITNEESTDEDERIAMQQAIKESKKDFKNGKKLRAKKKKADNDDHVDDDDDDDAIMLLDDESMDEDEKIALKHALKHALKQSKKEAAKAEPAKSKSNSNDTDSDEEKAVNELLDESSDDDEEEDKGDSYEEEKKEASSVLHTAEQLSAQVIKHMTGWTKEKDSSSSAHKGMIVDGALSLGFMQGTDSSGNAATHKWISQEEMQQACPNLKLSNYQLIGVNWLALLHGMQCNIEGKRNTNVNGVLADEMGLGKTVQTIAFLAWLKHKRKCTTVDIDSDDGASVIEEASWPHIIVVPVSVLPNWEREFENFCPEMNVIKYHGNLADREEIQDRLREYLPQTRSKNPPLDVILAPITYFQKEKSDDRKFLNKFRFDYLVVDEAHMLKNAESLRYKMLDRVSTRHRLLLTGTPVQNSPQELLNMLCFIMPLFSRGRGSMDGEDKVGDRMLQHFVDEKVQQSGDEQAAYKKLKQLFAPFVLRRKKVDVIAQLLPPKERVVEFVKLDAEGRAVYDNILADHVNKNGSKLSAAIGEHLFTNLRKAAHHPLLLRTRHNSPAEVEHLTTHFHKYGAFKGEGSTKARVHEEVSKYNDFNIHLTALDLIEENHHRRKELDRYILDEDALFSSAKFVRLKSLLPKLVSERHRILMFSVWTSCLDLLGCLMEHLELEYLRMDGSCSSEERQDLIDRFNRDDTIPVFLLSTKACGLGINLTAADTCIIHDLDFNPFNDLQAEDRCHRIGQKKPVTVYKLVTEDTVDSQVYEMQERKAKMNAAIMESKSSSSDKKERKEILQSAVKRFLGSPKGKKPSVLNKKNEKEVVCLI